MAGETQRLEIDLQSEGRRPAQPLVDARRVFAVQGLSGREKSHLGGDQECAPFLLDRRLSLYDSAILLSISGGLSRERCGGAICEDEIQERTLLDLSEVLFFSSVRSSQNASETAADPEIQKDFKQRHLASV